MLTLRQRCIRLNENTEQYLSSKLLFAHDIIQDVKQIFLNSGVSDRSSTTIELHVLYYV